MGQATTYRTCPRSGLQFEAQAEKLMIFNAVMGVLFLAFGGLLAICDRRYRVVRREPASAAAVEARA